jgi:hypothetical protein
MDDSALFDRSFVIIASGCVRNAAYSTAPIIRAVHAGDHFPAHRVRGKSYRGTDAWVRVRLQTGITGYVFESYGVWPDKEEQQHEL